MVVLRERKKAVYDFDEFLKIPPCAVGRHSAVVEEEEEEVRRVSSI